MSIPREQQRAFLLRLARQALTERGLEPDFPPAALAEAEHLSASAAPFDDEGARPEKPSLVLDRQ